MHSGFEQTELEGSMPAIERQGCMLNPNLPRFQQHTDPAGKERERE